MLKKYNIDCEYQEEFLILQVQELIYKLMNKQRCGTAELAKKLDISYESIVSILDGSTELSIRMLARILFHLDYKMDINQLVIK